MQDKIERMIKELEEMQPTIRSDADSDLTGSLFHLRNLLEIVCLRDDQQICPECGQAINKNIPDCPFCHWDLTR